LNEPKDRKLEMLNSDLKAKAEELMEMNRHILNLEHTIRMNEDILQKKEEEIASMTKVL
jgi:chromosome segregation ATPase